MEAIASGEFAPGQRLPSEREFAERCGVSRPTVREAMISLEIQGLVESRHGSGIFVVRAPTRPTEHADLDIGLVELTEARLAIEGEVCALAAVSIEEAQIAELRTLLLTMKEDPENNSKISLQSIDHAERKFHLLIAAATRNSALIAIVAMLWDLRDRSPIRHEMRVKAPKASDYARIEAYRAIVDAFAARNSHAARQAMRDHLRQVIAGLLKATETEAVLNIRREAAARRDLYLRRAAV